MKTFSSENSTKPGALVSLVDSKSSVSPGVVENSWRHIRRSKSGDDAEALEVAQRLVDDAGFDGVVVGPLEIAGNFDLGQPLARGDLSADELRALIDEVL